MKYIYALSYVDFLSEKDYKNGVHIDAYFYIGRTNNPERREKEHRNRANIGHEDVYIFIRELEENKIPWEFNVLEKINDTDKNPWEYYYIIDFIQKGCSLKNMKFGVKNESIKEVLLEIANENKHLNIKDVSRLVENKKKLKNNMCASKNTQARAIKEGMHFVRRYKKEHGSGFKYFNVFSIGDSQDEIHAESGLKMIEVAEMLTPAWNEPLKKLKLKIKLINGCT